MNDKRYLFRGFHPDENGNTIITLDGEKIKGEWKYWTVTGRLVHGDKFQYMSGGFVCDIDIIFETIGTWVTIDKNRKDIFDGDIVKSRIAEDVPMGVIVYDKQFFKYIVSINDGYEEMGITEYEPIVCGNKWEVQ